MFKFFTVLAFFLIASSSEQANDIDFQSYIGSSSNFDGLQGENFDTYSSDGDYSCDPYVDSSQTILCRCNATYCDKIKPITKPMDGSYVMYTTSKGGERFSKTEGKFGMTSSPEEISFEINTSDKKQPIFGFGGAFTDTASINILSLSEAAQNNLLSSYFSSEGIGYKFGRVPIGGTDQSARAYTLDEVEGDINLTYFNLAEEDINYKIPLIKRANDMIESGLILFASAWTAPTWMKTYDSYYYGSLKEEFYESWAWYHLKFLEAYQMAGVSFWAITNGNQPHSGIKEIAAPRSRMLWYPEDLTKWIGENLGPTLSNSQFNTTKIIGLDDRRMYITDYGYEMLSNPMSAQYISGIGLHWYNDSNTSPEVIVRAKERFPNIFILNTEASQGTIDQLKIPSDSWIKAENYSFSIIQDLNYDVNGWIEWNLAVDINGGPSWAKNFLQAPILLNAMQDEFYKLPMFYAIGHFSKFIKPGAVTLKLNQWRYGDIYALACLNEDGSVVTVLANQSPKPVQATITDVGSGQTTNIVLAENSMSTIIY